MDFLGLLDFELPHVSHLVKIEDIFNLNGKELPLPEKNEENPLRKNNLF